MTRPSRRTWLRWHVWAPLGVVTGLAHASPAHAETITDPTTDFAIDFEPNAEKLCILIPRERTNEDACKGLLAQHMADNLDGARNKPMYAAIARYRDWFFLVSITRLAPSGEIGSEGVDSFAAAVRKRALGHGEMQLIEPAPPPVLTRFSGVEVVEVSSRARAPVDGGDVEQGLSLYALAGAKADYAIFTSTVAPHASDVSAVMQISLATLRLAPAQSRAVSRAGAIGDAVSYLFQSVISLVGLIAVAWAIVRARRKSAFAAPPLARPKKKRKSGRPD